MTSHTDITQNSDTQCRDSLNWLAVQYVLGELSESEQFAFEERLASDSVACEAVADAARLTLTLQSAVADVAVVATFGVRSAKTTPRGSWLALAGASTAAAGLLAAMSLGPDGPRQTHVVRVDRSASELVSLWRTGSAATEIDADESDVEVAETNHDVAVPHWLFAAVSLEQSKPAGISTDEWQEN